MKNIFLIGMPSSGKSTLGRMLAKRIDYQFVDMDDLIEQHESLTVFEIFQLKGEDHFRTIESKILKEFKPNNHLVIATGGGAPCFFNNIEFIKNNGISVFLNVPPKELYKRILKSEANNRPLINKNNSEEAILNNLTQRYENRLQFYQQANIQIDGSIDVDQLLWLLDEIK